VLPKPVSAQTKGADRLSVRANKLELLERVADDLAHEIKNPLHSMVINLEVLKRRIARAEASGAGDMLRYVDVLGSELERVSHRIDLLLRMMRPGRSSDSTLLHEILDEMRELIEVEASRRSLRVEFVPNALGSRASLPREPGRQVILNLVLLLLDALSPGQTLRITTERDADQVRIRFTALPGAEDGATPDMRTLLAKPEAATAARRFSIAQSLAEELGGRVELEPGGGHSELTFSLPAAPKPQIV
jgi:signal transduction histidine kinase